MEPETYLALLAWTSGLVTVGIAAVAARQPQRRVYRLLAMMFALLFYANATVYVAEVWLPGQPIRGFFTAAQEGGPQTVRLAVFADPHVLGPASYWLDRWVREWAMRRAVRSVDSVLRPDAVVFLGDLLDSGEWLSDAQFEQDTKRFDRLSMVPSGIPRIVLVGNHDVGFHGSARASSATQRFEDRFGATTTLHWVRDVPLLSIHSMAMSPDGCGLCKQAQSRLFALHSALNGTRPLLLTHIPLFRERESQCRALDMTAGLASHLSLPYDEDAHTLHHVNVVDRDVLHPDVSRALLRGLKPRAVLSGHTHYTCWIEHEEEEEQLRVPEYTVASMNWRNRIDPSFLWLVVSEDEVTAVRLPLLSQTAVIAVYMFAAAAVVPMALAALLAERLWTRRLQWAASRRAHAH